MRRIVLIASMFASSAFAQAPAAPSPANLTLGREISAGLLPDGTYQRLMGGAMSNLMGGLTDQMSAIPLAPFLKAAGLPENKAAGFGQATLRQVMEIVDPAFQERMRIVLPATMRQIGKVMTGFEPQMREGMAQAYAARFTTAQLADIAAFFKTPSGNAFAAQNMSLAADPAVMQRMQAFMPTLMQALPGIMQKAQEAAAGLPKPKTPDMLTDADRARLAKLLGVDPAELKKEPGS